MHLYVFYGVAIGYLICPSGAVISRSLSGAEAPNVLKDVTSAWFDYAQQPTLSDRKLRVPMKKESLREKSNK